MTPHDRRAFSETGDMSGTTTCAVAVVDRDRPLTRRRQRETITAEGTINGFFPPPEPNRRRR